MNERITVSYESKPCYDIVLCDGFSDLTQEARALSLAGKKLCIVTDDIVKGLYLEPVFRALREAGACCMAFSFPAGEEHKNLDTVRSLYRFLCEKHFGRKDLLVALGGGGVGDLAGFAAATWLRGVDFLQIPTTLLAQVDSSIGGKTGVDFDGFKNMVGAFHMPRLVYANVRTLETLEARQFSNGFAEAMKHGLIRDQRYYCWLVSHQYEIQDRDPETMLELVKKSCEIKRRVVEADPLEEGERAVLNFGHTLGHAIEKASGFTMLHGECVALGCVAAAYISWKKELIPMEEYYEIRDMFVPFGLPISADRLDGARIMELVRSDKKVISGKLRFILLERVGKAVIRQDVTEEEMAAAIEELNFQEEARDERDEKKKRGNPDREKKEAREP